MEISTKNLFFAYELDNVVKDITLKFEQGHFYSILGPNGCGKTTLLDLLIGHLTPKSGQILLEDKDLFVWSKKRISRRLALVSQNYNINFPFTVKEIIMMGRHPYIPRFSQPGKGDIDIVNSVMERTGTDKFANRKITDLSGGERQRCVFARALCQDTPILFLDEAFSNMDISHTLRLLDIVKKEVNEKNRTVVSVFHDINLASVWSDILVFMKQGKVAAYGQTHDIMKESIVEEVFNIKSRVEYNNYSQAKQVYFKVK